MHDTEQAKLTINKEDFKVDTVDDEIRADELCAQLLKQFHRNLLDQGVPPLEAGSLAHGADYFIRDFVVGVRQMNIFDEVPGIVRQFAGNWYIVNTLDPEMKVIIDYMAGIKAFYKYLHDENLISADYCAKIEAECNDTAYYEQRIKSFWNITGDGYLLWERECSLKKRS